MDIAVYNDNRHFYGQTSAECTFGCPPWDHSHPFGNWGVDSNFGNRQDSRQFMGWKSGTGAYCGDSISSAKPEWNSCTVGGWGSGNSDYYNHPSGTWTEQLSTSAERYAAVTQYLNASPTIGCAMLDGYVMSFTGNYMDVYELDSPGSDAYVTGMVFPTVQVELDCPDYWYCEQVESAWVNNNGPHPSSTARIKIVVGGQLIE